MLAKAVCERVESLFGCKNRPRCSQKDVKSVAVHLLGPEEGATIFTFDGKAKAGLKGCHMEELAVALESAQKLPQLSVARYAAHVRSHPSTSTKIESWRLGRLSASVTVGKDSHVTVSVHGIPEIAESEASALVCNPAAAPSPTATQLPVATSPTIAKIAVAEAEGKAESEEGGPARKEQRGEEEEEANAAMPAATSGMPQASA